MLRIVLYTLLTPYRFILNYFVRINRKELGIKIIIIIYKKLYEQF